MLAATVFARLLEASGSVTAKQSNETSTQRKDFFGRSELLADFLKHLCKAKCTSYNLTETEKAFNASV